MLGEKIAEQRKKLGLSQEELAEKLNISQKSISKYELGNRKPQYKVLVRMAEYFGVTTDYLLGLAKGGNTMLGKRINELRKSSGMTQEEFGKKLGVIKQTVSSWENDLSEPNHAATIAIAKLFGVTTDYLLGAEGDAMGTEEKINEIAQRVGRNIRSIREQAGLSQDEFAEGFSVKQPTVANWETGKRQPDLNMLIQIAQFGGTSLDDLVTKDLTPPVPLYVRNMVYLRKKRGYSQGELATVLGLQGASSIDLVESGKCELPVSKLIYLAEFFGVTMDQITKQDLSQEVSGCRQQ
jgi:bacteriophage CI repressor helix-turn-helix domain